MPVHRVLVQGDQQIDPIAHVGDFVRAGADGEKSMAAANNGLVGVVDVQVQPTAAEDFRENVTRGGNALTGGAPNTNSEGLPHRFISRLREAPATQLCALPSALDMLPGASGSYPIKQNQDALMAPSSNADKHTPSSYGLAPALLFLDAVLSGRASPKSGRCSNLMIPRRICVTAVVENVVRPRSWTRGSAHAARRRRRNLECSVRVSLMYGDIANHPGARPGKFARIILLGKRRTC